MPSRRSGWRKAGVSGRTIKVAAGHYLTFPSDQPAGLERLAELHHARGDKPQALATWKQVREFAQRTPALRNDVEHRRWVDEQIAALQDG